ncbi:MAG: hypothetical protein A3K19_08305 [Lentisphaerae bacterium RIFOXYB12_FULL_65_16]|nr:MAG: hypothetical protein A3K18_00305 [Lentisphaerae bacterium RIFOXYA12_64_32]OGV89871.1 MAG: hypothetical protein A3K19_08305 [Lentisphaerae bacterium RIFOXYB12_FULL_65_16]
MSRRSASPTPVPADQFWAKFRSQAAREPRTEAVVVPWLWFAPSQAWAAAAAVAVLAGLLWIAGPGGGASTRGAGGGQRLLVSAVEEIHVFVTYSSVLILQDEKNGSTLVWLGNLGKKDKGDS